MVEVTLKSIQQDEIFEVDILEFTSKDGTISFTLEIPRGLLPLKKGMTASVELGEKEEDGDIVMKGLVYKVDVESKRLEVSFHGLWLRMISKKTLPFDLSEGQDVYLVMKFSK